MYLDVYTAVVGTPLERFEVDNQSSNSSAAFNRAISISHISQKNQSLPLFSEKTKHQYVKLATVSHTP